ncbi:peptidylprolyl isomerase [Candidatus Endobugula sertula]|uniref:Peptidyl-prolyl cis-trans isomerase n=1 Tax=Candidatus Endobugula sertula TaxID=62101 RepID=A0A1D2QTG4_9GAMM|nr:peptidylprolyl isomerase [Candidatus Endobugula sertula]
MTDLVIAEGTKVTLHFAIKMEDGNVVDSTFEEEPATFTVGDGNLLAGFEESLLGLSSGARKIFIISPEKGFGQRNSNNIQTIDRGQFNSDIVLEKGLVLSFSNAQDVELPGVVIEFDENQVHIDFNHPLAGRELQFEVQIINVEPAVTH